MDRHHAGVVVFLPGFLARARDYASLLAPVRATGLRIVSPARDASAADQLRGRLTAAEESATAAALVRRLADSGQPVWLVGHSRGGQIAWRAAESVGSDAAGLILIDPVDGDGRKPTPTATTHAPTFDLMPLIIGAGRGGRCAPNGVNHEAFAATTPSDHLLLPDCGHADMLNGPAHWLGRRLCGGSRQPDAQRQTISQLLLLQMAGHLDSARTEPLPAQVDWLT